MWGTLWGWTQDLRLGWQVLLATDLSSVCLRSQSLCYFYLSNPYTAPSPVSSQVARGPVCWLNPIHSGLCWLGPERLWTTSSPVCLFFLLVTKACHYNTAWALGKSQSSDCSLFSIVKLMSLLLRSTPGLLQLPLHPPPCLSSSMYGHARNEGWWDFG